MARSLWPREHGAYAQLLAPLITALVVVPPTWIGAALAAAACLAFLANEPLLVVLGHRGRRMREADGRRAAIRLALLVAGAAALAGVALAYAPRRVLEVAAIVAVPALITIVLAWRRAEKSVIGECVAAVALSGACAPVLVAAGTSWQLAAAVWGAWSIGYCATVISVHRVIARHRKPASWRDVVAGTVLAAATAASVFMLARSSPLGAAAPLALSSMLLVIRPPRATYLRAIGFVLIGASVGVAGLVFATL